MRDTLLNYWQLQDNLLQWYRSIFLTAQSILVAAASNAVLTSSNSSQSVFLSMLAIGVILLFCWFFVCRQRGCDVGYFQMQLKKVEQGEEIGNGILTEFKKWQDKGIGEKNSFLQNYGLGKLGFGKTLIGIIKTRKIRTREIMEVILPLLFFLLWTALTWAMFKEAK